MFTISINVIVAEERRKQKKLSSSAITARYSLPQRTKQWTCKRQAQGSIYFTNHVQQQKNKNGKNFSVRHIIFIHIQLSLLFEFVSLENETETYAYLDCHFHHAGTVATVALR